jgi:hypothetical protein
MSIPLPEEICGWASLEGEREGGGSEGDSNIHTFMANISEVPALKETVL